MRTYTYYNVGFVSTITIKLLGILGLLCLSTEGALRPTAIRLHYNGYSGLLVAINPSIPQDDYLVDDIKNMFTDGSKYLHTATANRAYFQEVTILVPSTWGTNPAWAPATTQRYQNADVILQAPPITRKSATTSQTASTTTTASHPYTRSFGGCGLPGVRINLFTDMFEAKGKLTFGPPERVLIHEWAHFRWGVFDEYAQEGEPQFYFSPTTGRLEAVRCNINMVGRIYKKNPQTGRGELCMYVNPLTGVYDEGCMFNPYTRGNFNDNITASIMDRPKVPTITQFCNDNQADSKRVHNYEAPSRHNRLCGSRSTWAIISESEDFQGGRNPPRQVGDTTPRFTVVRATNKRQMVLAIDSSGSMQEEGKLQQARQAATTLIEDGLDDGTSAGVVSFAASAKLAAPLRKMDSWQARKNASDSLPRLGREGTNVADGLLKSLEVLENAGLNHSESSIILLTDAKNTAGDDWQLALQKVVASGVVINVVAFTYKTNLALIQAATETGGYFYFGVNPEKSTEAVDGLLEMSALVDSNKRQHIVNILSRAKAIRNLDPLQGKFLVDRSLGRHTIIIVTYTMATGPHLVVTSPTGRHYSAIYPEYSHDTLNKRMKITIPKIAETGTWKYSITTKTKEFSRVSILVISRGRNVDDQPLRLTGAFWLLNNTWPLRSQIAAEVLRDGHPVKGVKVKAIVKRPFTIPVELELHDVGAGADPFKDDGVYNRLFNQFSTTGQYTVHLEAFYKTSTVVMATANPGSLYIDHPKLPSMKDYLSDYTRRRRIKPTDMIPPTRITDLRIMHTSHENNTIVLTWTAPGGDDDYDKAASYTIATTHTVEDMIHGKNIDLLDPSAVFKGNLHSPQQFGQREEMRIKLNFVPFTNISLVFAVFAVDDSHNKGDISNIVTAGFGFVPDFSSEDYIEEEEHESQPTIKVASSSQKRLIILVLGIFSGILLLAVIVSFTLYIWFALKKNRKEKLAMKMLTASGKVV